jgi:putative endopeptidase
MAGTGAQSQEMEGRLSSKRRTAWSVPIASVVVLLASPAPALRAQAPSAAPAAAASSASSAVGIDLEGIDRSLAPGDDFFAYANGAWFKATAIPPDRSAFGVAAIVEERTSRRTLELIQAAASQARAGSVERKVGDYYTAFMDEAAIEKRGLAPVAPELAQIAALADRRELARYLGGTLRADVDVLNATDLDTPNVLGLWIAQDLDEPSRYLPFLLQGGLDMPDREYYLEDSPAMEQTRAKCREHMARILELGHVPDPASRAARVFELERSLARTHASREDTADVKKGNNHWPRASFEERAPGLDWGAFFAAAGLASQQEFVVWQEGAVSGLAALAASEPLDSWKDYLTFHALERFAAMMPAAFGEESFAFHGTVLTGTPKRRARAERAVYATSHALGEAVGQMYVEKYFPPSAKARVEKMVANLITAFGRRIDRLDWMAAATREMAKAKLATLAVHVGYPEQFRDYAGLEVAADDAYGNAERAEMFEYRRNLAKLGRPIDRGEWVMTPQTVNAVNLPVMNAMNFPAAILQPPYFDPERPLAMDYGAIGATIGHEISHSFDDQGALFDASGRLRNWWTEADLAHFQQSAERLVKQFDAYQPLPGLHVNGKLTLSENVADVAGLAAAYDAYQLELAGRKAPVVAGLSGDQQFFLSYAQSWRQKMREPLLRLIVVSDGHAPDEFRADTVRNLDPWYGAFDVEPARRLFLAPAERVRVW